jgi:hypothetical protein
MRTSPDARSRRWHVVGEHDPSADVRRVPLDVELEALDGQLSAAGARARLAAHGSTQPTRFFAQQLRATVLRSLDSRMRVR